MRKLIYFFLPPPRWRKPVLAICGISLGMVIYAAYVSNAFSYLSDDPETCLNCHVMAPQYAGWQHSSHRENATCNDCHVPQNNAVSKYLFKAQDGMRHATIFTLRGEEQAITIKEAGKEVVQQNCIRCHSKRLDQTSLAVDYDAIQHDQGRYCWECHREVPHGRVRSLSSHPAAYVPLLDSPVPDWLTDQLKQEKNNPNK